MEGGDQGFQGFQGVPVIGISLQATQVYHVVILDGIDASHCSFVFKVLSPHILPPGVSHHLMLIVALELYTLDPSVTVAVLVYC